MKSISIAELVSEGFSEDFRSLDYLERPYQIPALIGAGAYIICFILLVTKKIDIEAGVISVVSLLLFCAVTMLIAKTARPKSDLTGRPMMRYKNRFPAKDVILELVYVCPHSKSYIRRISVKRGHGPYGPAGI
jgi:hypothetical protein